jgi:hypothetical protein
MVRPCTAARGEVSIARKTLIPESPVNQQTAKASSLASPQSLLLRADQIIEYPMLDPRGQLLRATSCMRLSASLGAPCPRMIVPSEPSAPGWTRDWTRRGRHGVATFYTTGIEHSPTSATGTGWERTVWHATQRGRRCRLSGS